MRYLIPPLILLLMACERKPPIEQRATPVEAAARIGSPVAPAAEKPKLPVGTPGTPGGLPDDRTPLEEPSGPIDPKSAEGAGQVVQLVMALIGDGRIDEAQKAWGPGIDQGALAPARLKAMREVHAEVGKPHDMEGAAGSSFVQVPARLYGTTRAGKPFNLIGELTLRRVNDVDGSSAAQRRWHIVASSLVQKS